MTRKAFIAITVGFGVAARCHAGHVYSPSELNAQPARFVNQRVTVSGFIRLTPSGHTLYESEALAQAFESQFAKPGPSFRKPETSFRPHADDNYCLTIANPDFMYDAPQDINRHAVVLRATFVAPYLKVNQIDLGACALNTAIRVDEKDFARRYPEFFRKR